jgi:hypothetical protein
MITRKLVNCLKKDRTTHLCQVWLGHMWMMLKCKETRKGHTQHSGQHHGHSMMLKSGVADLALLYTLFCCRIGPAAFCSVPTVSLPSMQKSELQMADSARLSMPWVSPFGNSWGMLTSLPTLYDIKVWSGRINTLFYKKRLLNTHILVTIMSLWSSLEDYVI